MLALHAAHLGLPGLMRAFNARTTCPIAAVEWAHSLGTHRTTLEGHTGGVNAVAAVPLPDGRVLLASGSDDAPVRLWDPATGTPVGGPLEGHTSWVNAVAAVPLPDGRVLLASGGHDGMVRLWDPATGTPAGDPLQGHTGAVDRGGGGAAARRAGAAGLRQHGRMVRLWDPAAGTRPATPWKATSAR